MKKIILVLFIIFSTSKLFAQSFNQYNTGTLYDSFENPAQKAFIPDSSREFAFNLFVPNFDGNFSLTGDAQRTIKDRLFSDAYDNQKLVIGSGNHFNYLLANANAYPIMFKFFSSLNGDVEIGFFVETRAEARGVFTDESVALFNGAAAFPGDSYTNIFNSKYQYQIYNEAGFSYREQITKNFALGLKLAYVAGYESGSVNIEQSSINIDKEADTAVLALQGKNNKTALNNQYPWLNPGVSFSLGTMFRTRDGFVLQGNIKDLGFIHWNRFIDVYEFNSSATIYDLLSPLREQAAYDAYNNIITANKSGGAGNSYNTPLDGRAELSVSKLIWANDDYTVKYTPTLIASKELFYTGFVGALVNPISYNNYTFTLSGSYTDTKLFSLGMQFMVKSPNAEFFIGSDRLTNSLNFAEAALKSHTAINNVGAYTGADISLGFSIKFGDVIEHPMNASRIPMDPDRGFIGRMWRKLFHPNEGTIQND
jgi:hypothetical protein